jgi:hypothetical protein
LHKLQRSGGFVRIEGLAARAFAAGTGGRDAVASALGY